MSKEDFKKFVRNNPKLIRYVRNKEMTWQSFYELYDMYGDNKEIWSKYLSEPQIKKTANIDFMDYIKNIDLDAVQESINSIQRVLGVVGDMTSKNSNDTTTSPRPLYQHLDD